MTPFEISVLILFASIVLLLVLIAVIVNTWSRRIHSNQLAANKLLENIDIIAAAPVEDIGKIKDMAKCIERYTRESMLHTDAIAHKYLGHNETIKKGGQGDSTTNH